MPGYLLTGVIRDGEELPGHVVPLDLARDPSPKSLRFTYRAPATADGVVVIKAQQYRSLRKNREDALARLRDLILQGVAVQKKRIATSPSRAARATSTRSASSTASSCTSATRRASTTTSKPT